MTLRLRFPDGSVETFRDDDDARFDFEMLAFAGREVTMTTADGRPIGFARQGAVELRDLVLAGQPVTVQGEPVYQAEEPSLERRPADAYPIVLAALIAVVIIGAVVQTVANLAAGA